MTTFLDRLERAAVVAAFVVVPAAIVAMAVLVALAVAGSGRDSHGPEATFTSFLQALDDEDWEAVQSLVADDCKGKDFRRGRKIDSSKPWTEQWKIVRVFESGPYGIIWTRTVDGRPFWQMTEDGKVRCTSSW